jgi:SAM-dependent methyltransferase
MGKTRQRGPGHTEMAGFWDQRAREAPFYFVDDRLSYREPDIERFWAEGRRDLDTLLEALGARIAASDRVVEIGCGVGRLTRVLAQRASSVQAIDVSSEMLARARALHPQLANVSWIQGDGASLGGVADASCDVCVSHVVFQHIPDPQITLAYVREIGRVLRSGGWAAFQLSNDPAVHRRRAGPRAWLRALQARVGRAPRGQRSPAWLGAAVDLDELARAAHDGGLSVQRIEGAGTQFCLVLAVRDS